MKDHAAIYGKGDTSAISVFKRRLSSVMALIMNRNALFFISAVILIALAACGKSDDEAAAPAKDGTDVSRSAAPQDSASGKKGPDLVKALRDNAGVVTPEAQAAAIERARTNAESAARAVGQDAQQVQAAGEAAVAAAQRSFQERQPQ